jgi:chromosome segregation ATPase
MATAEETETTTTEVAHDPEAQAAQIQADIDAEAGQPTDDERLQALEDHDQQMRRIAARATDLEMRWAAAKEEASALKKSYEAALKELQDMASRKLTAGPLFEKPEHEQNAWRVASINELADHGATQSQIKKLTEKTPGPIGTLGDLSDFLQDDRRRLTDIDGVGGKAAEAIEDALSAWFAAHPDECPPVKSDDDEEYEPVN